MRPPGSIILIGWLLIVLGALDMVAAARALGILDNPLMQKMSHNLSGIPLEAQLALAIAFGAVTCACGVGALSGANWIRWVYLIGAVFMAVFDFITMPDWRPVLLSAVFQGAILVVFFLPNANQFFSRRHR